MDNSFRSHVWTSTLLYPFNFYSDVTMDKTFLVAVQIGMLSYRLGSYLTVFKLVYTIEGCMNLR